MMSHKNPKITDLEHRVQQLSSLIEVSIIINSLLDLDELIIVVMEKAQSVMQAEASSVMLINEETDRLECEVALGEVGSSVKEKIQLTKGQGIAGTVWQTEKSLIVQDVSKDKRFFQQVDQESGFETRSILASPLIVQNRIIGVAEVLNRKDGQAFDENDQGLFETFCRQVALAIENARLHQYELEQERLQQQLESARVIQESFMPQQLPSDPEGRFKVAAKTEPAKVVGGDFYDFIELDKDHLGFVIGDVSGKGIPAALFMARLVSDFRFLALQDKSPGETLSLLNNQLVERSRRGMFVTLQYAILDLNSNEIAIADAGHLPPILISGHPKETKLLHFSGGIPLGIMHGTKFETKKFNLKPGDTLCQYTDGATEAKNANGEQFTIERLQIILEKKQELSQLFIDGIFSEIHRFSKNVSQHDDITILMLSI